MFVITKGIINDILAGMDKSVKVIYHGTNGVDYDILLVVKNQQDKTIPEMHGNEDDIYYIVEGEAILQFGGEMLEKKLVEGYNDQYICAQIVNHEEQKLVSSDFAVIPRGVPHRVKLISERLVYLVIKER